MVNRKICEVCRKRKGSFPLTVKMDKKQEKDIIACKFCCRKYMLLRERYLIKAYVDLVEQVQKVNKYD